MKKKLHLAQQDVYFDQLINLENPKYNAGGYFYVEFKGLSVDFDILPEVFSVFYQNFDAFNINYNFDDLLNPYCYFEGDYHKNDNRKDYYLFKNYSNHKDPKKEAEEFINEYFKEPIDILSGVYSYWGVIKLSDNSFYVYAKIHHFISDALGFIPMIVPLQAIYFRVKYPKFFKVLMYLSPFIKNIFLKEKRTYFKSIISSNEYENSTKFIEDKTFWIKELEQFTGSNFQITHKESGFSRTSRDISKNELKTLKKLSKEIGVSVQKIISAAFIVTLGKLYNKPFFIGGVSRHRRRKDEKNVVGMFSGVVPYLTEYNSDFTFRFLLDQINQSQDRTFAHKEYPITKTIIDLKERGVRLNNIIDFVVNHEKFNFDGIDIKVLKFSTHIIRGVISPLEITLSEATKKSPAIFELTFLNNYFGKEEGEIIFNTFSFIINQLPSLINDKISTIPIVSSQEREEQLVTFNDTNVDYPRDKTVIDLFREQVEKSPKNIALVNEEQTLTYQELEDSSNELSNYLIEQGVEREELVPILLDRSVEMVVGILGIMKSGGAYVPIDPAYPAERINYMLEDINAQRIITIENHKGLIERLNLESVIYLDAQAEELSIYSKEKSNRIITPDQLAYVIYTSGSTGKPKGVLVEHGGVVNLSFWYHRSFDVSENSRCTMYSGIGFDASVWEVFAHITKGACLFPIKDKIRTDVLQLVSFLTINKISHCYLPPKIVEIIIEKELILSNIKIISAGEVIKLSKTTPLKVYNNYGPTENTVCSTYFDLSKTYDKTIPIGRPISNTQVYILDAQQRLLPRGVVGELCIGGAGLARGYLNQPALTQEKFISNPFRESERLYRTGDLARWLPDGNIEYVGRMDNQVKIRGYRIELGEIEAALQNLETVKQAVVLAKEDEQGSKYLVGYVLPEESKNKNQDETQTQISLDRDLLQSQLRKELPDYMVPSVWVELEELPLTRNGKVDRKGLPEPDGGSYARAEYVAPSTDIEKELVNIWQEVLGIDKAGIRDNFFALGGDSIKAIRLVSKLRSKYELEMPVGEAFSSPTVEQLARYIETAETNALPPITRATEEPSQHLLSYNQERLWVIDQLVGSVDYHMPGLFRLEGNLDKQRLEESIRLLVDRHEILRTTYKEEEGVVLQEVQETTGFGIEEENIEGLTEQEKKEKLLSLSLKPYDLRKDYMLKVYLLKDSEDGYELLTMLHHISGDGWSMPIIAREIGMLYQGIELAPLPIQYKDYSKWQRRYIADAYLEKQLLYWEEHLEGVEPINLPIDYARPKVQTHGGSRNAFTLDEETTRGLKELNHKYGVTLFMSMLSIYKVLLNKYSGQGQICVGTPMANREQEEIGGMVGFFVNTLALNTEIDSKDSFEAVLEKVKQTTLGGYNHQQTPFDRVVDRVVKERDTSRSPLFQVMFVMQNNEQVEIKEIDLGELRIEPIEIENPTAKFELTLEAQEVDNRIQCSIEYNTDLFKEETIERFISHFKSLTKAMIASPREKLSQIDYLSDSEREEQLIRFNDTTTDYPKDKTVLDLFHQQVQKHPEKTALVYEEEELSYQELENRSNQLANYLLEQGTKREELIPILIDRSLEMVVGILGIMKSGGAYVPIDPTYPAERISYMLEDIKAKRILTTEKYKDLVERIGLEEEQNEENQRESKQQLKVVSLDSQKEELEGYSKEEPNTTITPNQMAYVIYTSGSTGKPKGVMVEHGSLINRLIWQNNYTEISSESVFIQKTPYVFDVSVWELLSFLIRGSQLVLLSPGDHKSPTKLQATIAKNQVDIIHFVPSMLSVFIEEIDQKEVEGLKHIICSGEALSEEMLREVKLKLPKVSIHNLYGPTEATVDVTGVDLTNENKVSIGRPISNTQVYILDAQQGLLPRGVVGELCIGGAGLARGYLNQPELTKEKFIANPFREGERLYRTGDLARWLPDGNIEYVGRMDNQVKIRGYRIELGEIEAALQNLETVKQAVVLAKEDEQGSKYLVGYVLPEESKNKNQDETQTQISLDRDLLQSQLRKELPDYMVPSVWVELEELPLTRNGKVDRKGLPEPDGGSYARAEYVAPSTDIEKELVNIWQEVLGIDKAGIRDNFFALGGDSIKAIRLVSKLRSKYELEMPVGEAFSSPTVEQLARYIETAETNALPPITRATELPSQHLLSYNQERLWVIDQLVGSVDYHMPGLFRLEGNLDKQRLEESIRLLVDRHEILRTTYKEEEGVLLQEVQETTGFGIEEENIEGLTEQEKKEKLLSLSLKPYDLRKDYMLKVYLLKDSEDGYELLTMLHHISGDGWSMPIIAREIGMLYQGIELAPLPIQYKDYSKWQRRYIADAYLEKQLLYWEEHLEGVEPINLPIDYARPKVQTHGGSRNAFTLDEETTRGLKELNHKYGVTMFMSMLSIYKVLLNKYSGQGQICVGTPMANREQEEIGGMVGFFVNTLALNTEIDSKDSFEAVLEKVKQTTLGGYNHQQTPFDRVVDRVVKERDTSRSPLFQVMFVMQNNEQVEIKEIDLGELRIEPIEIENPTAKFELTLEAQEVDNRIQCSIEYNTDLFKEETIERFISHFKSLTKAMIASPREKLSQIDYLSDSEREEQLIRFNDTTTNYPKDKTVLDLFREQVEKNPNNIALIYEEEELSYQELENRSNQLANYLLEQGTKREELIPILIDRSLEMVVGILGIMKSGGAYVPIDPTYPAERISYMLEDINAKRIITTEKYRDLVERIGLEEEQNEENQRESKQQLKVVSLDSQKEELEGYSKDLPHITITPDQLAYVIYTSGSTGKPKGVMVEHGSLINRLIWQNNYTEISSESVFIQKTPYVFDVSVWELLSFLIRGSQLVLLSPGDHKSPTKLQATIAKNQVDIIHFVPSMLSVFIEEIDQKEVEGLKHIICSGEALSEEMLREVKLKLPKVSIHNLYGPTEATVDVTGVDLTNENKVSIGRPISNTQVYILDAQQGLLPRGVVGELCIGGAGLARGYLNQPELTKEKFIANPFREGERLYRTGDLARWLPDGNIEYVGRMDNQVKIRGYRIELGEIEAALQNLETVKQSVVLAKEDEQGGKYLVGYVVSKEELDKQELQNQLKETLPDYMVPSVWVELEELPLTRNGKVDRKALPEPDGSSYARAEYVAPSTDLEIELVNIWQEVLGIDKVGIKDNFFALGGDSIKGIQVISRARKLGYDFAVKDILTSQNIHDLSSKLREAKAYLSEQGRLEGELPLLPIQRYFFEHEYKAPAHYNQSVLISLSKEVSREQLEEALKVLVRQHDALALSYEETAEGIVQRYNPKKEICLEVEQVKSEAEIEGFCSDYQRRLSLSSGQLSKFILLETSEASEKNRLFMVVHHLGIDGVSWRILLENLQTILLQQKSGLKIELSKKGSSYRQWGERLQRYSNSIILKKEQGYWKEILIGYKELRQDKDYQGKTTYEEVESCTIKVSKEVTQSLLKEVNHAYGTEINDVLLSALSVVFNTWQGTEEILIGLEGHGREELFEEIDISNTVGWFTSLYPVRLKKVTTGLSDQIIQTKEMLRRIPNKGIGYGVLRYLSKDTELKEALSKDITQVVFNYLGDVDSVISGEGMMGSAAESTGSSVSKKNHTTNKLSLNSIVIGGELQITWSYDGNRYNSSTVEGLAKAYQEELERYIAHCKAIKTAIKTPSDYGLGGLVSHEELQSFKGDKVHQGLEIEDIYRLSPLQQGLLFHSLYEGNKESYTVQFSFDLLGGLNREYLEQTWNYLFNHYSILRTGIHAYSLNEPVQVVYEGISMPIQEEDYRGYQGGELEEKLKTYLEEDKHRGFDLTEVPLIRLSLLYLPGDKVKMVLTNHHILWDGWSFGILMASYVKHYESLLKGEPLRVLEDTQPKDIYREHVDYIYSQDQEKGYEFWVDYLVKLETPSYLPFVKEEKKRNRLFTNSEQRLTITEGLSSKVLSYSKSNQVTVNTILQGTWSYVLSKLSGQEEVVFGATVSGRDIGLNMVETKVGLYINTIPVATSVREAEKVTDWLQELQEGHREGREHAYVPLNEIQKRIAIVEGELFDSLMVFENYPVDEALQSGRFDLEIENVQSAEQVNYVLGITCFIQGEEVQVSFKYNEGLLTREEVDRIATYFENTLSSLVSEGVEEVGDISYLPEKEREEQLITFNDTTTNYPKDKTVLDLFHQQVQKHPEKTALVYEEEELSYQELENRSNQLANYLLEQGTKREELVPILLDRSIEMVVGILGIMKSGGAYVPIDPTYPAERISYMLEDIKAKRIVTTEKYRDLVERIGLEEDKGLKVVCLDSQSEELEGRSKDLPNITITPDQLAYVIYTSGSTGKPKGVTVEHGGLVDYIVSFISNEYFLKCNTFGILTNLIFDSLKTILFGSLLSSKKIYLLDQKLILDANYVTNYFQEHSIDCIKITPSMYQAYSLANIDVVPNKLLIFGGEELPLSIVSEIEKSHNINIINHYGPTETIVGKLYTVIGKHYTQGLIGKPFGETEVYILDAQQSLLPRGVVGELCIGGAGLARGYLNQPELTKEKFIANPFREGERLYRTGDLARWLPDGNIEYVGRKDNQVKIRGYRIELGEIEAALQNLETVKQAVVLAKEDEQGSKFLVGYVVPEMDKNKNQDETQTQISLDRDLLQSQLREVLPDYMVPAVWVELEELPLTRNGKVDRKGLPEPDGGSYARAEYVAPSTDIEKELVNIWQEVLGIEKVGIKDNFFTLGGDSIKAIRLISRIRSKYEVGIQVGEVFSYPTIEKMTNYILVLKDKKLFLPDLDDHTQNNNII